MLPDFLGDTDDLLKQFTNELGEINGVVQTLQEAIKYVNNN